MACLVSTLNKLIIIRSNSGELAARSWKTIAVVLVAGIMSFIAADLYLRLSLGWTA
jgi:hypothetical protein